MKKCRVVIVVFMALAISLGTQAWSGQVESNRKLSLAFEEELTLNPGKGGDLLDFETSLELGTSVSGVEIKSETTFGGDGSDGLTSQKVNLAYEREEFATSLESVFDPPREELSYMLQRTELNQGNLELVNLFLLEYVTSENTYGAGFETELTGRTDEGTRISATARFGMDVSSGETYDPSVDGSGYRIITESPAGPSGFPFGSALIVISDVGLGPCTVANRTKFTREKGFLFSGFSFGLIDKGPWETRSYVYFSDEGGSITLVPTFQFGEGSWEVVAGFGGKLEGEATTLDKLVIRGIKFNDISIGGLKLSGISALGGKMKKEKGAGQLDLHAGDYKVVRSFSDRARNYFFEEVDWSDVITLEHNYLSKENLERYLALDWYLKGDETGSFLNVDSVNAVTEWELSSAFSFDTGISLKTRTGLEKIVFNIAYDF